MSAVNMQGMIGQMRALAGQTAGKSGKAEQAADGGSFGQALQASIEHINDLQQTANGESQTFQAGKPGIALYDVVIDTQKASLALQMGIQVRNRLVDSYKQVMNMQV